MLPFFVLFYTKVNTINGCVTLRNSCSVEPTTLNACLYNCDYICKIHNPRQNYNK